jgi:hypothetical protein
VAGRMKGMRHRWMRFEPYWPQAYWCTPEGIWRKARRIGRILFMRPATPLVPHSSLCLFVGLTRMLFEEGCHTLLEITGRIKTGSH